MKHRNSLLSGILFILSLHTFGQNMPSLLTDKDINATFAILAFDENTQEWGIAVATNNICVGNSTIYITPGIGAFCVIAETEPDYGIQGIEKLRNGRSIEQAIVEVKANDKQAHYRQVSGIDAEGNVFAFTGNALNYWNGSASQILGKHYVVMGNQLSEDVLSVMSDTFKSSKGTLAQRLLKSLIAGEDAGGQISGKQSAAIVVKGTANEWYNQIDLRVDNAKNPIQQLKIVMDYHYGRIRLNQALYAHRSGNKTRAKQKLTEAEAMLEGWTGIYARIAQANIVMGNEASAIVWIKKGLAEDAKWSVYLPAFYALRKHPEIEALITPDDFSSSDWQSAMGMLSNLGRETEVIALGKTLADKNITSPHLSFMLGRSYFYEKETKKAIVHLQRALQQDSAHTEAQQLLRSIMEE